MPDRTETQQVPTIDRPAVNHRPIGLLDLERMTHPSVEPGTSLHDAALRLRGEAPPFLSDRLLPFAQVMMYAELHVQDVHGKLAGFALRSACQALVDHRAGHRGITPVTWERYVRLAYAGDHDTVLRGLFSGAHWTWQESAR